MRCNKSRCASYSFPLQGLTGQPRRVTRKGCPETMGCFITFSIVSFCINLCANVFRVIRLVVQPWLTGATVLTLARHLFRFLATIVLATKRWNTSLESRSKCLSDSAWELPRHGSAVSDETKTLLSPDRRSIQWPSRELNTDHRPN
ncbi:hypothetical protein BJY52DRAFT_777335 [Lactarius psammicola]|nr:hypothetical protein BJY52DRAFT_777335 [Lactarius psammicola]